MKGQLDISFTWLFGLIIGAIILGLAIYATVKIIGAGEKTVDASTAKQISVLLNPLQLGVEDSKSTTMTFSTNIRIYPGCDLYNDFGDQKIRVSQEGFKGWTETDMNISATNLYLYMENPIEGKKLEIFSKKFEFPYKVADLIYIIPSTKQYCFVNPPENIEEEIKNLNLENLKMNCTDSSVKVCFDSSKNCDIRVDYKLDKYGISEGEVVKKSGTVYFAQDSLMYAGIFSEKSGYECQLKRLMKKTSILASLYYDKSALISRAGCNSNVESDLLYLKSFVEGMSSSQEISTAQEIAKIIGGKNDQNTKCKLW